MCKISFQSLVADGEGEVEALVGAAEVEVVELEAPVGAEGEVGSDSVANAGADAHEIAGFGLLRRCLLHAGKAVVVE